MDKFRERYGEVKSWDDFMRVSEMMMEDGMIIA